MKTIMLIGTCLIGLLVHTKNQPSEDLERIRTNYAKAADDKSICKAMIQELSAAHQSPVKLAYLGGFKAIWAKHTLNPISKLGSFNSGKKYIELAVSRDPENVEVRFIRLSIQKNSPSFLGYKKQIDADKRFINANMNNITSAQLKKMLADVI